MENTTLLNKDVSTDPQLFQRFMKHLSKSVVHDKSTKTIVFYTAVSAYTKNPINLFLRGESSTGKTYNVTNTLQYFSEQDCWILGGLSPKAIVHEYGVFVDDKGKPIEDFDKPDKRKPRQKKDEDHEAFSKRMKEWKETHREWSKRIRDSRVIVDLNSKILVFLEPPPLETYNTLRPILSHDKEEISYKFTDKISGRLRTAHVVVRGWPATIFLSTKEEHIQELATRSFTITPESHESKHRDAIRLQGKQKSFPWKYNEYDLELTLLRKYVETLRDNTSNLEIVIPFARELAEAYPAQPPRSMRDFNHINSLLEACTLFHTFQRPAIWIDKTPYVMCTLRDLNIVSNILPEIEETTVTGLPRHILDCFHKVMEPLYYNAGETPFNYSLLTAMYNETFDQQKSGATLRGYVKLLRDIGWVDTLQDPQNKRYTLITIIKKKDEDMFGRVLSTFSNSFALEKLKSWFDDTRMTCSEKHVIIKQQINDDTETTLEAIYKHHFLPALISLQKSESTKHVSQTTSDNTRPSDPQKKLEDVF